ncbi:unnamed protein product, partial [marine sediment metagenome]
MPIKAPTQITNNIIIKDSVLNRSNVGFWGDEPKTVEVDISSLDFEQMEKDVDAPFVLCGYAMSKPGWGITTVKQSMTMLLDDGAEYPFHLILPTAKYLDLVGNAYDGLREIKIVQE